MMFDKYIKNWFERPNISQILVFIILKTYLLCGLVALYIIRKYDLIEVQWQLVGLITQIEILWVLMIYLFPIIVNIIVFVKKQKKIKCASQK